MALDDVINAGRRSKGADEIVAEAKKDSGFNAGGTVAVYDGLDPRDPAVRAMAANSPVWHRDYAQRAAGEYKARTIDVAQVPENLTAIWGAYYRDPQRVVSYLVDRPLVNTGQEAIDQAHNLAFVTNAALKDEKSVKRYIDARVADLRTRAEVGEITKATADAVDFTLNQNPRIAMQAIATAAGQAKGALRNALGDAPQTYLEARYNTMNDNDKRDEAYSLASGLA